MTLLLLLVVIRQHRDGVVGRAARDHVRIILPRHRIERGERHATPRRAGDRRRRCGRLRQSADDARTSAGANVDAAAPIEAAAPAHDRAAVLGALVVVVAFGGADWAGIQYYHPSLVSRATAEALELDVGMKEAHASGVYFGIADGHGKD